MIKPEVLFLCTGNSRQRFNYVVTLCDREQERTGPIFPGAIWRVQWDLENPAKAVNREERWAALRRVRDDIQHA